MCECDYSAAYVSNSASNAKDGIKKNYLSICMCLCVCPTLLAQRLAYSKVTGCHVFQSMSHTTDDMSGWLNKDTYLSNVILMSFTSKPPITQTHSGGQLESYMCLRHQSVISVALIKIPELALIIWERKINEP